jgi:Beta/Gamma crystallin
MNRFRLVFRSFKTVSIIMLLLASASNANAEGKECWADFFEHSQYAGKHLLIQGPAKLENLNKVNGEDWNQRIHSIKVGPKAKVTVYQNPRFELPIPKMLEKPDLMKAWGITEQDIKEDSELIFNENATIHDLGDFGFHKKIRSLRVECL